QYLTDGGVYDNLGIDRLLWYHKTAHDLDLFLASDAEGNFDWDLATEYKFVTGRNVRASNLLMKRVSDLQYQLNAAMLGRDLIAIGIDTQVPDPDNDSSLLSPEMQRALRNIRTDLVEFGKLEIDCLIRHGYSVARKRLAEAGLLAAL